MMIRIHFFGMIAEALQCTTHVIEDYDKQTIGELEQDVLHAFPGLDKYTYQIALNKKLVSTSAAFNQDCEVAFLPPFAGG